MNASNSLFVVVNVASSEVMAVTDSKKAAVDILIKTARQFGFDLEQLPEIRSPSGIMCTCFYEKQGSICSPAMFIIYESYLTRESADFVQPSVS